MPFNVGPLELIVVLALVLLVVGPRRLPEMGNAIGKTIREFRDASSDISETTSLEPSAKPQAAPPAAEKAEASPVAKDAETAPETESRPTPVVPTAEPEADDD